MYAKVQMHGLAWLVGEFGLATIQDIWGNSKSWSYHTCETMPRMRETTVVPAPSGHAHCEKYTRREVVSAMS